jgi:hypothetical protein
MEENTSSNWKIFTMEELWELCTTDEDKKKVIKPKLPTKRWGDITTKISSTDKNSIEKGIQKLKEIGVVARKRVDHDTTEKHKNFGKKFYKIEIKEQKNQNNNKEKMSSEEKINKMACCLLEILDYLKLQDKCILGEKDMLELNDETLSEMMFRKMEANGIDLNKELGFNHLKPIKKNKI